VTSPARRNLFAWIAAAALSLGLAACGKQGNTKGAADSTATDSTSLAEAKGSLESEGENYGGGSEAAASAEADTSGGTARRERSVTVNAARAIRADLVRPVVAEGRIRARHAAEIHSEITGRIVRVLVEEGQKVKRGQLILKIDDREYEMAAEEARARYLQALSLLTIEDADVDTALATRANAMRDELADLERLEKAGKITREERLAREIGMDVQALKEGKFRGEIAAARSGVSIARADLERARLNLERTEIRAPFDGVISGLTLSAGEQLKVNQTLCTLVDNVNIEAEVGVLEADVGKIAPGGAAILAVPALGDTFAVEVGVVSPQFDATTRTCQVLIRLQNAEGRMRPGMFTRALIAGERFRRPSPGSARGDSHPRRPPPALQGRGRPRQVALRDAGGEQRPHGRNHQRDPGRHARTRRPRRGFGSSHAGARREAHCPPDGARRGTVDPVRSG
jgi:multidrug efflux pump subunit AcrA (membrane-fusion protein)